jgi:hypothetical protein
MRGTCSSKLKGSVNLRWTNFVLYGIKKCTETRLRKVRVNKKTHKYKKIMYDLAGW